MALYAIDDHGLIADVDHYRGLEETRQVLLEEQKAIDRKLSSWWDKWGAVQSRLIKAHTRTHLHPYLEDKIEIPEYTITRACEIYKDEGVGWLPHPWYHYADTSGTTATTLFQPQQCFYYLSIYHEPRNCLHPHLFCNTRTCCLVPAMHAAYGGRCPHQNVHIHDDMNEEYQDAEDGKPFDDEPEA
ncbi:hypothetical protein EI94DRAFT_1708827 [Lactarius quietus]|nr:hypothetical protein EI94DRAFT_1708827 [Lactarius quietus]